MDGYIIISFRISMIQSQRKRMLLFSERTKSYIITAEGQFCSSATEDKRQDPVMSATLNITASLC